MDTKEEYPELYNAELKNEEDVINYLAENYKAEYANIPATVSIPFVFSMKNYDALFVEYQDERMAICYDLFTIDKTGKLISEKIELTYHYYGGEMIVNEFFKLTRENNTIDLLIKRIYEGRTETVILPPEELSSFILSLFSTFLPFPEKSS